MSDTGGGASERVQIISSNITMANVTKGTDQLIAGVDIDVSNVTGTAILIGCQLFETAPSLDQAGLGTAAGTYGASYPFPTSAQLAKLNWAKLLPDANLTAAGSFRESCQTPPFTTQATATAEQMYIYVQGSGTWSATAKLGNAWIRKANSP